MEVVNRLSRHPNVVPLFAYYFSKDEKLLAYEYMPAGSLSAALHVHNRGTGQASLDWDSRLSISLGAAKGLTHIHSEEAGKFTHGNIKSLNILLNGGLTRCVTDFGLSPMMNLIPVKCLQLWCGRNRPKSMVDGKCKSRPVVAGLLVMQLKRSLHCEHPNIRRLQHHHHRLYGCVRPSLVRLEV